MLIKLFYLYIKYMKIFDRQYLRALILICVDMTFFISLCLIEVHYVILIFISIQKDTSD